MMVRGSNSGAQSNFLQTMADGSAARLSVARRICSEAKIFERAAATQQPPLLKLADQGFDLIAELKRRSPAEGELATASLSLEDQVRAYTAGGAAALSVLTEPEQFNGSLADMEAAIRVANGTPVMRKDFLVDAYQVAEARASGASGVLLIAAILERSQMQEMMACAAELGLFVLMEVFDEHDIEHCLPVLEAAGPALNDGVCQWLLGVNCRDLRSLQVSPDRFATILPAMPAGFPWVAESGVRDVSQAAAVAALGYRMSLVGTALMKSGNPSDTASEFIEAGRGVGC
ncbi:MAG: indole-3-glycerol phosphate synthase TrpC [Gammaproteobacteria bacterium]|nr:indole-3-glycerol phosphate synthase TrpC [Gammaproteobacteria bacterium]